MPRVLIPLLFCGTLVVAACSGNGETGTTSTAGTIPLPTISTSELPRAERTTPYSHTLTASTPSGTGPVVWSLGTTSATPPSGLTLSASGVISGTPTEGGLFEMEFVAENAKGGSAAIDLDLIVYEPITYSHAPDIYDTPANNDYAGATYLGAVTTVSPLVQTSPLSLTSNPSDINVDPTDIFQFSTATSGELEIEVFFANFTGTLYASIHGDHKGQPELKASGVAGANGDDQIVILPNAPAGLWYLKVDAKYKNATYHENAYSFRIRQRGLTITSDLVEHDSGSNPVINTQLNAEDSGVAASGGIWSLQAGALPAGVVLDVNGNLTGTPTETGLFTITTRVEVAGRFAERSVEVRILNAVSGDYWQRLGQHRYYDVARTDGDGVHHEHYCEATVVAPHPDYGVEGAIYVIGGRTSDTKDSVFVFHTDHQADNDKDYKLQDIGRSLTTERQYLGAAFLQHSYGGYIYVVGGELYSNMTPSNGLFCRTVERMQVSDGSGVALSTLGNWEVVADLPAADAGGRLIEGFAEFGLVAVDSTLDADDRLFVAGGRVKIETAVGSASYTKEYYGKVLMFEAPLTAIATGTWYEKADTAPYTPRRFPCVGLVDGRIYLLGGKSAAATEDIIEMYEPDLSGTNAATATAGSASFPALGQAIWYGASTVHNGEIYILNGWKPPYMADRRLQKFTPNVSGTAGAIATLTAPDVASGYHSTVFHDGKLWFVTGRDPFAPAPNFSLRYEP